MKRRLTPILALIAVACAMLAGLGFILQRHAQQAESYPAYSAFRTLPEGTSVLYEALERTQGMRAERNTQPLGTVHYHDAAILMLGVRPDTFAQWFEETEELSSEGNRVIVGFVPHHYRFIEPKDDPQVLLQRRWSVHLAFVNETDIRDDEEGAITSGWPMYFDQHPGWQVVRKEFGRAVVIERLVGKGSMMLIANPYLFSNSAMVDDRQTTFIAGIIGTVHQTVFDETHFGIEQTGSIAALARRYRLQGLILALAITAALFVWKSASGFPPPQEKRPREGQPPPSVAGEDSAAAFLNLLRRNIRPDEILSTCVEAWRRMYERKSGRNLRAAIDLAESGRGRPAETYAAIQRALTPGREGRG